MACLDANQIVAFCSSGRTPALAAQVEAHAANCRNCRELLAQYAKMSAEGGTASIPNDDVAEALGSIAAAEPVVPDAPPRPSNPMLKLIGTVLKGKWQIDRLLGVGGMGYVFAARHRNGRRVAIKCMRPELATDASFVERFLREGYLANKIEHPGAVAILDDDVMDDGTPFLVMELLTGQSLRERLNAGTLGLQEALDVIAGVLDVLAAAHEKGIVHRDLKPDNLFQTTDGKIKVLDFGIARMKEQRAARQHETLVGTTMGTVGFMAPEQARGLTYEIDAQSDLWSVGATLFALLAGRPVHQAETTNQGLLLAMTTPVRPMAELLPTQPIEVHALLDRALAFEKSDRFPSAQAMKAALDAARARAAHADADASVDLPSPAGLARAQEHAPRQEHTELMLSHAPGTMLPRVFEAESVAPRSGRNRKALAGIGVAAAAGVVVLALALTALSAKGDRTPSEAIAPQRGSAPSANEPSAATGAPSANEPPAGATGAPSANEPPAGATGAPSANEPPAGATGAPLANARSTETTPLQRPPVKPQPSVKATSAMAASATSEAPKSDAPTIPSPRPSTAAAAPQKTPPVASPPDPLGVRR